MTASGDPLPALPEKHHFDAAVLDLRPLNRRAGHEVRGIGDIRVGCVGKLLVVIAEVNGPKTLGLLERYLFSGLPETLLWLVSHRYKRGT